eukprot:1158974-Pelagomonas_calceolata.AAC.7
MSGESDSGTEPATRQEAHMCYAPPGLATGTFLLQLSCPRRQAQLCNAFLLFLSLSSPTGRQS